MPDVFNLYGARGDREEGKETRKIVRELSMKGERRPFQRRRVPLISSIIRVQVPLPSRRATITYLRPVD